MNIRISEQDPSEKGPSTDPEESDELELPTISPANNDIECRCRSILARSQVFFLDLSDSVARLQMRGQFSALVNISEDQ